MARNIDRDAQKAAERKKRLLEVGFVLFSKYGIESVSLQTVAKQANVNIATMYNYFQNKENLVIAISTKVWSDIWNNCKETYGMEYLQSLNAYQLTELYDDIIIDLYKNKPEVLCFSSNYKTFIRRSKVERGRYSSQIDALEPIRMLFHQKFEEAIKDGSIRSDISEEVMFSHTSLTMLAMAERYAQGLVWADTHQDHIQDLLYLKEMILDWIAKK